MPGQMPDGAVIIAAITSCTNTSNPRNVIAAGLLARNANALGLTRKPWVKIFARAGLQGRAAVPGRGRAAAGAGEAGLRHRRLRLHDLQRHVAARWIRRSSRKSSIATCTRPPCCRATATSTAASIRTRSRPSWPRRRWWSPTPSPAPIRFDIEKDVLGVDADGKPVTLKDIWPSDEEIDAVVAKQREARAVPQGLRPDVRAARPTSGAKISPLYDWRPQSTYIRRPPYWEGALAGERTLTGMRPLAVLPRQHHHRSPVAVQRDHARQRRRRIPGEDGPAGRGLQFLRDPSRRSPDRAARDLRQSEAGERDGAWSTGR